MSREAVLEQIHIKLQQADDKTLQDVLLLLVETYPLDDWDREIIADNNAGKFDALIEDIQQDYYAGNVILLGEVFRH
ncbi:MAG: hypothetical protein AAF267_09805 [Deinococcota bacterium]